MVSDKILNNNRNCERSPGFWLKPLGESFNTSLGGETWTWNFQLSFELVLYIVSGYFQLGYYAFIPQHSTMNQNWICIHQMTCTYSLVPSISIWAFAYIFYSISLVLVHRLDVIHGILNFPEHMLDPDK